MQDCIYSLIQDESLLHNLYIFAIKTKFWLTWLDFLFYFKTDIRLYFLVQWAETLKIKDNHIVLYIDL